MQAVPPRIPHRGLMMPDAVALVTDRIVHAFQPERIILFGSMARGEATSHSDLDLLIVMPDGTNHRETTAAVYDILRDVTTPTDIVVSTPAEIAEWGHLVGTILRPALREGIVLYDRS